VRTIATCAVAIVVGVEERADIDEGVGAAMLVRSGVVVAVPCGGDADRLDELRRACFVEHERARQPIRGWCETKLTFGFGGLGKLDERFGSLTPELSGAFGVGDGQRCDDLHQC